MTHDVAFLRHMTSILNRLISKSVHTLILPVLYIILKIAPIKSKYSIIKHRAFFKTLIAACHPFILDGFL